MPAAQHTELDDWLDSARITRVFDSYFRALDEKNFDVSHFRRIFTTDARVVRPNGAALTGPPTIAAGHAESFTRFEATQHLLTGHDVAVAGETGALRANLVAIHLWADRPAEARMLDKSFTAGGVVTAGMLRTSEGWRIVELENRVVWRAGRFGSMKQTR